MADSFFDMHVHSTASDGTDAPEELIEKAANSGIKIIAITDHDLTYGCDELSRKYDNCRIASSAHRAYKIQKKKRDSKQ